jgi:hypothetical protein
MRAAVFVFALASSWSGNALADELRVDAPAGFHVVPLSALPKTSHGIELKDITQAFATDDKLAAITVLNPDLSVALFNDDFLRGVRTGLEKRGAVIDSSGFVDVRGARWAKVVAHYRDRDEYMEQWFTTTVDHIGQIVLASHASRAAADAATVAQVVRTAHGAAGAAEHIGYAIGSVGALVAIIVVVIVLIARSGKKKST